MIIKSLPAIAGFRAGDGSFLKELLHPSREPLSLGFSLAHAVVAAGGRTLPHRLEQSEVYYILAGRGRMRVGDESAEVGPGQAVYIPPRAVQSIEALGPDDLAFLCVVDPAWTAEGEEIL
jgi:mannose-6-phosphate isomerase-like protein (cupin superfamily)